MNFHIISIFPEMLDQALSFGVVGQARNKGLFGVDFISPRQFTKDFHKTVDDRPFGGGDGMVMLYEPLAQAVKSLGESAGHRVYLSATGRRWSDSLARKYADRGGHVTLVCGRYGGVDQRFINEFIDEEISIGDYIISGGEPAAIVLVDSVIRLRPEVLGNQDSARLDSFADQLLEAPLFTRPAELAGAVGAVDGVKAAAVPKVFTNGDHKKIDETRRALQFAVTLKKRPDLLARAQDKELQSALQKLMALTENELRACGLSREDLQWRK